MDGTYSRWYKDAVIYQIHVKSYFDSDDDGCGDFVGLTQKLDYIKSLGVTAIWLLPFYPSPLRDDGYDIADYKSVNPRFGTMRDFRNFVRVAHRLGLKIITELVINHTSDQHPWFQRARRSPPGSSWRNYYVWSDTDQKYKSARIIFTDTETSNWAWDPVAKAYYWHRFFAHQPDLNFDNPQVVKAVLEVMRFWLDAGVDGMRLDAIPYLIEREGTSCENLPESHALLKHLRAEMDARFKDRMFLAEANQWPEDVRPYFGDGDECHMAFHFPLMPRVYMAVAQEDRHPITDIMCQTPEIPDNCQWAIFLRNHDELTLEMVTSRERDYLWRSYAEDPRMRLNVGIRRRLSSLMGNDRRKIELLNSLLMSMPGTPIVYYGDEIGMGDNIFLGDRDGVRTPMQWSPDRNGGFSRADPHQLYLPAIMDPVYGYGAVNVEAQSRNAASLLNWTRRLIQVRQSSQVGRAFGRGRLTFLYPGNRKILAYIREYDGISVLCVANMSRSPQAAELDLSAYRGRFPIELLGHSTFPPIGDLPYFITLTGYGFYWFLLATEGEVPSWHVEVPEQIPDFTTLVLPDSWGGLVTGQARGVLERSILPHFLPRQRWFGAKVAAITSVELVAHARLEREQGQWLLTMLQVRTESGEAHRYFLPLALVWERDIDEAIPTAILPFTMARVRTGAEVGWLHDAVVDAPFALAMLEALRGEDTLAFSNGTLRFHRTSALETFKLPGEPGVRRLSADQSNSSIIIGESIMLKFYRRLRHGMQPELEMGHYLTEVARFPNTPPLLGYLDHVDAGGDVVVMGVLQGFVANQGDGWAFTLAYLERVLDETLLLLPEDTDASGDHHATYFSRIHKLGRTTGELHVALAGAQGDPAMEALPVSPEDLETWRLEVRDEAQRTLDALEQTLAQLPAEVAPQVQALLKAREALLDRIDVLVPARIEALKTRIHGDYHLGQVLVAEDEFFIIDFEGEPARSIQERRARQSPLKDVAGMLRSFNYAAWAAMQKVTAQRPEDLSRIRPWAEDWERRTVEYFLEGYHAATAASAVGPSDVAATRQLVELFALGKALYEIRYELANRPAWLRIPVEGVLSIISRDPGGLHGGN